jgi:thiamine biosynthesis lipoprotein
MLSVFLPDSEISRVNASAGLGPAVVSEETFGILKMAHSISQLSGGAFDITIGPLVRLWSVTSQHPQVPPPEAIAESLQLVGYRHLKLEKERLTCFLPKKAQALDLGGIAKGYAADRAAAIYRECGVGSSLIDIGGNVNLIGGKPGGGLWVVGVQDPCGKRGDIIGTLRLTDTSVVTSGGYERGFSADGVWHHHIIDPRSGYPSQSDIASITVMATRSIVADALSTAAFVLGTERGVRLLEEFGQVEAILVKKDRSILVTDGLTRCFSLCT